jgi:hypothetical protein
MMKNSSWPSPRRHGIARAQSRDHPSHNSARTRRAVKTTKNQANSVNMTVSSGVLQWLPLEEVELACDIFG